MQLHDKLAFLKSFFQFQNPKPLQTCFSEEDLKSNDMKISLQIATHSNLRMQSDPKTNLVSFSCKSFGKNCFEIFAFKNQSHFKLQTDYTKVCHQRQCELHNECYQYLKIYNLMKLKKNLIESIMLEHNLLNSSPSEILSEISQKGEYFFEKNINYNPEMRRKLRKRFDNIINIDIKKITKGGREECNDISPEVLKQKKYANKGPLSQEDSQQVDDASFLYQGKGNKKKSKRIKRRKDKNKKKLNLKIKKLYNSKQDKENVQIKNRQPQTGKVFQRMQDQIYVNPASECELKQIKELNEEFNGYGDIFSWSSQDQYQPVYLQTINDKLRESVFISLRNSMLKKSFQTQSLSNFPETLGNLNDFNEEEQMI